MKRGGINYARYGYIFSIPFILVFLVFSFYPIIYTTVIGFTDLKGLGKTDFNFLENPFENFQSVLNNPIFIKSLKNTAIIWIMNFIPQIVVALMITAWFTSRNYRVKGQGMFKILFYMPNIMTAATIAILFYGLFGYPMGPINYLLQSIGLIDEPIYFFVQKGATRGILAFIQFWMWYGYTMLVLISGVLGLNPELFEASEIDGASGFQIFFYVTLPNLRTILLFTLITSLIGGLQIFDIPRLLNLGGPDNSTLTTSVFIFNQAFSGSYMYNRAAAASVIMFIIILIPSLIIFYVMRDKDAQQLKKIEKAAIRAAKEAAKS